MKPSVKSAVIVAAVIAAAVAGLVAYSTQGPPPDRQAMLRKAADVEPAARAPNFALPDLDGDMHALSQWRGKVRLLNFWATWCGPCRDEIPALVALQKRFGDKGLQIVGIATNEPGAKPVKKFAREYDINYPLLMDNGHAANIASHLGFNLIGLPASVLLDGDANIIGYHLGPIDPATMRRKIEKLLNGGKKATNVADRT